jgi:hypothetical protein
MSARRPIPWRFALPLLLLFGAGLNILIAWFFLIWIPPPTAGTFPTKMELIHARSRQDLREHMPSGFLPVLPHRTDFQLKRQPLMISFEARARFGVRAETASFLGREAAIVSAGFPLRSLSYTIERPRFTFPLTVDTRWGIYLPGIKPAWPGGVVSPAPLPLRPEPLSFLANTLFYTLLLALAWRGLRRISKAGIQEHRRQHGRCIACGYDLTRVPVPLCPECGSPAEPGARVTILSRP